jgi:hypothetical protein
MDADVQPSPEAAPPVVELALDPAAFFRSSTLRLSWIRRAMLVCGIGATTVLPSVPERFAALPAGRDSWLLVWAAVGVASPVVGLFAWALESVLTTVRLRWCGVRAPGREVRTISALTGFAPAVIVVGGKLLETLTYDTPLTAAHAERGLRGPIAMVVAVIWSVWQKHQAVVGRYGGTPRAVRIWFALAPAVVVAFSLAVGVLGAIAAR